MSPSFDRSVLTPYFIPKMAYLERDRSRDYPMLISSCEYVDDLYFISDLDVPIVLVNLAGENLLGSSLFSP